MIKISFFFPNDKDFMGFFFICNLYHFLLFYSNIIYVCFFVCLYFILFCFFFLFVQWIIKDYQWVSKLVNGFINGYQASCLLQYHLFVCHVICFFFFMFYVTLLIYFCILQCYSVQCICSNISIVVLTKCCSHIVVLRTTVSDLSVLFS